MCAEMKNTPGFPGVLSVSKKSKIRIVGGGALDAPAVKRIVFYLLPANS